MSDVKTREECDEDEYFPDSCDYMGADWCKMLNIKEFLLLIGKGPEQCPEWWRLCWHAPNGGIPIDELPESVECDTWEPVLCPFQTIVSGDWTPEKDTMLLGTCLEYCRSVSGPKLVRVSSTEGLDAVRITIQLHNLGENWHTLCLHCETPGLTLATAIWNARRA